MNSQEKKGDASLFFAGTVGTRRPAVFTEDAMDDGRRRFRIADALILIVGLGTSLVLLGTVAAGGTLETVWPAFLDEDGQERSVKPLATRCPLRSPQG
jgi:hypothetical protein